MKTPLRSSRRDPKQPGCLQGIPERYAAHPSHPQQPGLKHIYSRSRQKSFAKNLIYKVQTDIGQGWPFSRSRKPRSSCSFRYATGCSSCWNCFRGAEETNEGLIPPQESLQNQKQAANSGRSEECPFRLATLQAKALRTTTRPLSSSDPTYQPLSRHRLCMVVGTLRATHFGTNPSPSTSTCWAVWELAGPNQHHTRTT